MQGERKKHRPNVWKFWAGKAHLGELSGKAAWCRRSFGHRRVDRVPMGRAGTTELLKAGFGVIRQGTFYRFQLHDHWYLLQSFFIYKIGLAVPW